MSDSCENIGHSESKESDCQLVLTRKNLEQVDYPSLSNCRMSAKWQENELEQITDQR